MKKVLVCLIIAFVIALLIWLVGWAGAVHRFNGAVLDAVIGFFRSLFA